MESNLSNAGTLNSQTLDDFDWGNSPAKDPEDNHSNPSNPIDKK